MMEQLGGLDPSAVAGALVSLLLLVCVAALFLMRDPESAPPRAVSRSVWCAPNRRHTTVDFVERVETGLPVRIVQRCELRGAGQPCNQECCDLSFDETRLQPPAKTAHRLPTSA